MCQIEASGPRDPWDFLLSKDDRKTCVLIKNQK